MKFIHQSRLVCPQSRFVQSSPDYSVGEKWKDIKLSTFIQYKHKNG